MPETKQPERLPPRATSNRNGGRDHLGILGEIKSVHPGEIIGIRRPSKASWVTRSRTRRRDRFPFFKSNSQTSAGVSYDQAKGLTEAIPSEPPSLARPDRRATAAEKG